MKLIRKIITIVILVIGIFSVVNIFYPEIGQQIKDFGLGLLANKKVGQMSGDAGSVLTNVLGEEDGNGSKPDQEEIIEQLKGLPGEILTQEVVEETTQKINKIISEKYQQVKDLPEQQFDQVKKEVKQDIYQSICEDWLKTKLIEEKANE